MQKSQVHVQFYQKAVQDKRATREQGRPIYKDVEYVRIRFPGDNKRELHAPAHEKAYLADKMGGRLSYAEMYAEHYKLFRDSAEQVVGTPLTELPFLTAAQRETLKGQNIATAEMLAEMPDRAIKNLGMNWRPVRDQAKAYLEKAAGSADVAKLSAENAELSERLKQMEAMMAEMQKQQTEAA